MITSPKNPLIRALRGLHRRRQREEARRFLVEGVRLVETALAAQAQVEQVLYVPDLAGEPRGRALLDAARARQIPLRAITAAVMDALTGVEAPQPVAAVVRRPPVSVDAVLAAGGLFLVADRLQDPGNLGTIVRTAAAAGAAAVAATPGTVDPYNPKAVRATMGALFHLPVFQVESEEAFVAALCAHGVRILVADVGGEVVYTEADYTPPVAIVVGSEAHGVGPHWREAAATTVRIPIPGQAESLNAAVAAALLLYEAVRPRFHH